VVAVGIAVAAFMATSEFASKMTDLGYATYIYVDSKCGFFTSVGLEYLGYQQCNGSLKISNGVFNTVILSNDPLGKSEFGYDVQFDNNIICKSGIVNANDRSLAIISSEDLNLSSTGEDVNINAAGKVVFNSPEIIVTNGVNDIIVLQPVGQSKFVNDVLFNENILSRGSIVNYNDTEQTFPLNIISSANLNLTSTGVAAGENQIVLTANATVINNDVCFKNLKPIAATDNLTISHNNVICQNTLVTNTLSGTIVEQTTSNLTINHPSVIIENNLKVDQINSVHPSTLNTPTYLSINHDNVAIPINFKTDRILPCFVPPVTIPETETNLTMSHDNVIIQNKLKVNNTLDCNVITAADIDLDINCEDHAINLGSRTNEINIGNKLNPNACHIYLYGRLHTIVNTADDGFFEEVNGFLNQTGI
jgi:hypothetical protein